MQVFPSEQPVVNPMTARQRHQQLLRQRNLERERLLQQRRQQQQQQQQQQGGYVSPDDQRPAGQRRISGQQRPSIKLRGVDEGGLSLIIMSARHLWTSSEGWGVFTSEDIKSHIII